MPEKRYGLEPQQAASLKGYGHFAKEKGKGEHWSTIPSLGRGVVSVPENGLGLKNDQEKAGFFLKESRSCASEYAFTAGLGASILTGLAELGPKITHVFQLASCTDICVLH